MGHDGQSGLLRDSGGDLVARYTYAPGYIDDVAVQERDLNPACERSEQTGREPTARVPKGCDAEGAHNADDGPPAPRLRRASFGDANEVVYYHQNTLFSVYAVSDASQSVVERYRYDAYGGCGVLEADGSADADGLSDVGNPYLFTGRRRDPESALMQYRHRYYSPTLGRFLGRDSLEYLAGFGLYQYASGRPTLRRDPLGLQEQEGCEPTGYTLHGHGEWILTYMNLAYAEPLSLGSAGARVQLLICVWEQRANVTWRCCCPDLRPSAFEIMTTHRVRYRRVIQVVGFLVATDVHQFPTPSELPIGGPSIGAGIPPFEARSAWLECDSNKPGPGHMGTGLQIVNPVGCAPHPPGDPRPPVDIDPLPLPR